MMIGIDYLVRMPKPLKGSQFASKTGGANRIFIKPTRHRFVVDQHGTGLIK